MFVVFTLRTRASLAKVRTSRAGITKLKAATFNWRILSAALPKFISTHRDDRRAAFPHHSSEAVENNLRTSRTQTQTEASDHYH